MVMDIRHAKNRLRDMIIYYTGIIPDQIDVDRTKVTIVLDSYAVEYQDIPSDEVEWIERMISGCINRDVDIIQSSMEGEK